MDNQIIIAIISSLGIWTFIWALINFFLWKNKELLFAQIEQREKRYKSSLLFMETYLNPEKIPWMNAYWVSNAKNKNDILEYLISEYNQMILYSWKNVILSVKHFIENPTEKNFLKATVEMRKDLWNKRTDLKLNEIQLSLESK